jgi:hypothetical protein
MKYQLVKTRKFGRWRYHWRPFGSYLRRGVTRFDPGNAHAWGLSNHGAIRGSGELDGDQMTQRNTGFTQVRPPWRVKTYVLLCLTLLLMRLQRWCLQRWRRLDLAEGVELLRIRALGSMMEKVSRQTLGPPSQPFICEGWVSGLLPKLTTYKGGRWNPNRVLIQLGLVLRVLALHAKSRSWAVLVNRVYGPCHPFSGRPPGPKTR